MPRQRHLSDEEKGNILAYHDTSLNVSKKAEKLKRSRDLVNIFFDPLESYGKEN